MPSRSASLQEMRMKVCRHCARFSVSRPRGLCWVCYYSPGVKDSYPPAGKVGPGAGNVNNRLPDFPTNALPGTPEKLAVFERRLALRRALFHPNDAQ